MLALISWWNCFLLQEGAPYWRNHFLLGSWRIESKETFSQFVDWTFKKEHKVSNEYEITFDVYYLFDKSLQTYIFSCHSGCSAPKSITLPITYTGLHSHLTVNVIQESGSYLSCHLMLTHLLRRKMNLTLEETDSRFLSTSCLWVNPSSHQSFRGVSV